MGRLCVPGGHGGHSPTVTAHKWELLWGVGAECSEMNKTYMYWFLLSAAVQFYEGHVKFSVQWRTV